VVDRLLTAFVTHGHSDARHTVTLPAAEHHRPLAGTKLYFLVTEARGCEQLVHSCYLIAAGPQVEPSTAWSKVGTTMASSHSFFITCMSYLCACLWMTQVGGGIDTDVSSSRLLQSDAGVQGWEHQILWATRVYSRWTALHGTALELVVATLLTVTLSWAEATLGLRSLGGVECIASLGWIILDMQRSWFLLCGLFLISDHIANIPCKFC